MSEAQVKIKTFQDVIDLAGGVNQMCLDLNVHKITIERWSKAGFPEKYVVPMCNRYNLSTNEIRRMLKRMRSKE